MKLKPAKQALADAIHQNGGWGGGFYSAISRYGCIVFWHERPSRSGDSEWHGGGCVHFKEINTNKLMRNWHQCILSRDEYFTAYPDKVNVEVKNETEHKVEAEMKSESEMAIKVSDWHKNGELPPVGEVCEAEYNTTPAVWESVRVIGFDDCECVFMWISGDKAGLIGAYSHPKDFRPLRAERDRAIEYMISVINKSDFSGTPHAIANEIAELMFEDGYRKDVK